MNAMVIRMSRMYEKKRVERTLLLRLQNALTGFRS